MLSREYYHLSTQLPVDRFLTPYYGDPRFHINNILVIISVRAFMLASKSRACLRVVSNLIFVAMVCLESSWLSAKGNLLPNQDAVQTSPPRLRLDSPLHRQYLCCLHCVFSALLTRSALLTSYHISQLTLPTELVESDTGKAFIRLRKRFLSLCPIFSTQIYTKSIPSNLSFSYIATGRGFATTCLSFRILYSQFARSISKSCWA